MRVLLSYFKYKATHASDGLLLYALVLEQDSALPLCVSEIVMIYGNVHENQAFKHGTKLFIVLFTFCIEIFRP